MPEETILFILVILAGFYMAWNIGANDVANAMGTSVGSHAITLKQAIIIASILEFSGAYFFGSHVTETLQKGIVNPNIFYDSPMILVYGMLAALIASGGWLQLASYFGWPVSTTHSIVGAIVGFGLMAGGYQAIYWGNVANIVLSWIISPIFGAIISFFIFRFLTVQIIYRADPVAAAKKITPYIVFVVFSMLSMILVLNGLKNLQFALTPFKAVLISIIIGAIASLVSYFLLKKVKGVETTQSQDVNYNPEVGVGLEKAIKHLNKVRNAATGEMLFHVDELLEEIQTISSIAQEQKNRNLQSKDYVIVEKIFGYLQIVSACLMAFAHGANDVANAIGPIAASVDVLRTHSIASLAVIPTWTLVLGGAGIVIGLATWGWRVIETIGKKITELTPTRGFAAEFGAAFTILVASRIGMPISTTHTLVGSVIGVGMARGIEALNINTLKAIIFSWIVTVPAGALLSVIFYTIILYFFN